MSKTYARFLSKSERTRIHIIVTDCMNYTSRHVLLFTYDKVEGILIPDLRNTLMLLLQFRTIAIC